MGLTCSEGAYKSLNQRHRQVINIDVQVPKDQSVIHSTNIGTFYALGTFLSTGDPVVDK